MGEIFISYAREDAAAAERIARALEAEGYEAFWDAHIAPHQTYGDVIKGKIADASAVIVVWSEESSKSMWVRAEAEEAYGLGKLVQTVLDDCSLPMPFGQIQTASLAGWKGEGDHKGWRDVMRSLDALKGEAARPVQPMAPATSGTSETKRPIILIGALATVVLLCIVAAFLLVLSSGDGQSDASSSDIAGQFDAVVTPPDQLIADSGERALTLEELSRFNASELRIARNEIFARKGRMFLDPALRAHFERYDWYTPIAEEVELTAIEEDNVRLIRSLESE